MISDFIISVLYNTILVVANVLNALDDVTLPSSIDNSLGQLSPYYSSIETVFPIGTLIDILGFELIVIAGYFFYKLIRWGYRKIPGVT